MHRRHRVSGVGRIPHPELGRQLGEPGRQHRRVLRSELPAHSDLGQLPMRVLQRHAGLPRAARAAQRHHPRPGAAVPGQQGIQLGQQLLSSGQEHRPRRQPQHPAHRYRTGWLLIQPGQLVQLALDSSAQPLDQALQISELRRTHLAGHLIAERAHQRGSGRILQIRQAHVGNVHA